MKPQHKGIYTELPMGFKIDHSKTKLLGVQCYGPDGKPSFFIPNKLDNMNTQDNKVFKLYIKKTHPKESGTYTNFEVGQSVTALEEYIRKTYKVDVLIKDPEDDFPYFTDGGFKYTAKGDYWHYEFTCYPDNLILASHSVSEGGESKRGWEIVRVRNKYYDTDKTFDLEVYEGRKIINGQNYEYVLNCLDHKYTIESVKRLSDGEVFQIGDKVTYTPRALYSWNIDHFFLRDDGVLLARAKGNEHVEIVDKDLGKAPEVKVSELHGREKQIYDYAYKKGLVDGDKTMVITRIFASMAVIFLVITIVVVFIKNV